MATILETGLGRAFRQFFRLHDERQQAVAERVAVSQRAINRPAQGKRIESGVYVKYPPVQNRWDKTRVSISGIEDTTNFIRNALPWQLSHELDVLDDVIQPRYKIVTPMGTIYMEEKIPLSTTVEYPLGNGKTIQGRVLTRQGQLV